MSLHGYFISSLFQKEGSGTSKKISWELVMQRYARHRRFIFSISAIYLEAAQTGIPVLSWAALASH